jgi:hypothetical protein
MRGQNNTEISKGYIHSSVFEKIKYWFNREISDGIITHLYNYATQLIITHLYNYATQLIITHLYNYPTQLIITHLYNYATQLIITHLYNYATQLIITHLYNYATQLIITHLNNYPTQFCTIIYWCYQWQQIIAGLCIHHFLPHCITAPLRTTLPLSRFAQTSNSSKKIDASTGLSSRM